MYHLINHHHHLCVYVELLEISTQFQHSAALYYPVINIEDKNCYHLISFVFIRHLL